jgi:serine/threonine protein kinase
MSGCGISNWTQIGQGTFGKVYSGMVGDRIYAIKLGSNLTEFYREAAAMKKVSSIGLLPLSGLLQKGDECISEGIVLPLGIPLSSLIGHMGEQEKKNATIQLLNGLIALTDAEFVHLDIKPENVIKSDGGYGIADFGGTWSTFENDPVKIYKTYTTTTSSASPNVVANMLSYDTLYASNADDIYSLGVTLLSVWAGKHLFDIYTSDEAIEGFEDQYVAGLFELWSQCYDSNSLLYKSPITNLLAVSPTSKEEIRTKIKEIWRFKPILVCYLFQQCDNKVIIERLLKNVDFETRDLLIKMTNVKDRIGIDEIREMYIFEPAEISDSSVANTRGFDRNRIVFLWKTYVGRVVDQKAVNVCLSMILRYINIVDTTDFEEVLISCFVLTCIMYPSTVFGDDGLDEILSFGWGDQIDFLKKMISHIFFTLDGHIL